MLRIKRIKKGEEFSNVFSIKITLMLCADAVMLIRFEIKLASINYNFFLAIKKLDVI